MVQIKALVSRVARFVAKIVVAAAEQKKIVELFLVQVQSFRLGTDNPMKFGKVLQRPGK